MARIVKTRGEINAATPVMKTLSFRVPEALFAELEALRKRAEKFDDEVDFRLDPMLADALKRGIKSANKTLDLIESERYQKARN